MSEPATLRSDRTLTAIGRLVDALPVGGVVTALIFFALSLTPSLLPRNFVLQGILSGCVFAAGYAIGVSLQWIWNFLELPRLRGDAGRAAKFILIGLAAGLVIAFLWFSTGWQNSIRGLMSMAPVESTQPIYVVAIAVAPALVLIAIGTLIVHGVRFVARYLRRIIPRRVALVVGILTIGILTSLVVNGIVLRWLLYTADRFYADLDALAGQYQSEPLDPLASGSAPSLIAWDTIGLDARVYVQTGPTAEEIGALTGKPAEDPLRVYVGLRSAETVEARAQLAFAEMQRVGAFEKSVLVLIMPVGTGWVDPPAIDTLEILHGGDVASVAVQYSYLTSWLSLVVEPDVGTATAEALFAMVYQYWTNLPVTERPKLYLHGLSLGAYASQASATIYDVLADPYQGALWVGPPFSSQAWRSSTLNRQPGSPFWQPRFGDGSVVRFANQSGTLDTGGGWGPMRILYLQYPSDPIVFFDPASAWRPPAWLNGVRPPDVSPLLNWYPVVTFLQLLVDMVLAQTSPIGYGHVYAPQDYLDAWVAVTAPEGWTDAELAVLRDTLARSGERQQIEENWFRPQIESSAATVPASPAGSLANS
jgi:uncharacterized membrane protein